MRHEVNLEKQVKEADEQYKKLEKENKSLKKSQETLKWQVTSLSDQVRKARTDGYCTSWGRSHTKSPSDFSSQYQWILKKKWTDRCSDWLGLRQRAIQQWSFHCGMKKQRNWNKFIFLRMTCLGQMKVCVSILPCTVLWIVIIVGVAVSESEIDVLNMMIYVKDRFNISGDAYHEMAQLCRAMPRHYKLKDRISELNKLSPCSSWHMWSPAVTWRSLKAVHGAFSKIYAYWCYTYNDSCSLLFRWWTHQMVNLW